MKVTLFSILAFTLFVKHLPAQNIPADSLRKYSYSIAILGNGNTISEGTCFFTEVNNDLYLATAFHVIYDTDFATNTARIRGNTCLVNLSKGKTFVFKIKQSVFSLSYLDTDLIVFKIDRERIGAVNSIETFFKRGFEKYADIEIFGQGITVNNNEIVFGSLNNLHLRTKDYEATQQFTNSLTGQIDSLATFFMSDSVLMDIKYEGFSGSPVFIKEKCKCNWLFIGVLVEVGRVIYNGKRKDYLRVIKPKYVMQKIDENN